ncbi:uncharacterized protein [Antedon mediterranea]|uniref:uncharacterized protein isoform X2 n=1 Tax=Antedon mediterranea TaxID=105859 RepID=UPI003AF80960
MYMPLQETTTSKGIIPTMLPFMKSSSTVSREDDKSEENQKGPTDLNSFWNDDLSIPMYHTENGTGMISVKKERTFGSPLQLSPLSDSGLKRYLIHPSMLRKSKAKKEKKQRKLRFNIDEHLAQLRRKQTGFNDSTVPRSRTLYKEKSVTVKREDIQPRSVLPTEIKYNPCTGTEWDNGYNQPFVNASSGPIWNDDKSDFKFDPTDDISNPFLTKPRMMYPIELRNDYTVKEKKTAGGNMVMKTLLTQQTTFRLGIEE